MSETIEGGCSKEMLATALERPFSKEMRADVTNMMETVRLVQPKYTR
jgi:lambda repressor-like predicted transcriptional regulator